MFVAAIALSVCSIGCGTPVLGTVTPTENPLVAQYTVSAPVGSFAMVEFGPDTNYGFATSAVSATAPAVTIFVAGMRQNSAYHMRAVITHADGTRSFDIDHVFSTGSAPASRVPVMAVTLPSAVKPSPGVTLVCLNPLPRNPGNLLRVLALDSAGELIWYYDFDPELGTAQPIKLLPNGHFLMVLFGGTTGPGGLVREIDLTGHTVHEFTVDRLNQWLSAAGYDLRANAIHHDIAALPNGHLLVLVNTHKNFTDLPGHRGVTTVLGDAVVDLDRRYQPVWVWSSFDHLDVNRHPMMFPDWTHTNTILYLPEDGNLLLSLRNQSWFAKIDYANGQGSGNVLWRLGYQGDFTLLDSTSPADWFFAQHFASLVDSKSKRDFRLSTFDNGNNRFPDFNRNICPSTAGEIQHRWLTFFGVHVPACYSRPVVFQIDEARRTARPLWSDAVPYSYWGGVNMELPNGNLFFDDTSTCGQIDWPFENPKRPLMLNVLLGVVILGMVILVLFWHMPVAVIPFLVIPIAVIVAFAPILGGIALAIGLLLDATLVVLAADNSEVGNEDGRPRNLRMTVISVMKRVNRPSFFAVATIALSFLPVFTPVDKPGARILEVTPRNPPQLVWGLDVSDQESYRTIHLPSLYPGVQW